LKAVKREWLLRSLASYRPFDEHESRMLEILRRFVVEHADCFERSLSLGHITGSAWIVDLQREQVLLTHHHRLDKWLQLGGHADGDPDILRVALREAREESGVEALRSVSKAIFDVDVHEIPARGAEPAHYHYDVRFLLEADRNLPLCITSESKALAWVRLSEVDRLTKERSVLRMVAKTPRVQDFGK
jgi:8-oxo-dGTP pyrophosphatase MutT (NUDIX family)